VQLPSPQTTTRTALRYGVPLGMLGSVAINTALFLTDGGLPPFSGSPVIVALSLFVFVVFYFLGPTVVLGVPVVLYLRFGLRSPVSVFVGAVLLWGVVGGSARLPFVFVLIQGLPMAVLYGVVGTLEWYVRDRRGTLPPASVS